MDYKYKQSSLCQSKVCADLIKGYDCGDEVADWISEALGISYLRLIRQSDEHKRINKKNKSSESQTMLSLSNQAQFLLINKGTVRWLKSKIHDPLFTDSLDALTDRFRGNLVIDMDQELVERDWQKVIIDGLEFNVCILKFNYYFNSFYTLQMPIFVTHTSLHKRVNYWKSIHSAPIVSGYNKHNYIYNT